MKAPDPRPGFFKLRMKNGAVEVGAIIYQPCPIEMNREIFNPLDRVMPLLAMVNGEDGDKYHEEYQPWDIWAPFINQNGMCGNPLTAEIITEKGHGWVVDHLWFRGCVEITEQEYLFLIDDRKWAKAYDKQSPEANPHKKVFTRQARPEPIAKVDVRTINPSTLF